MMTDSLHLKVFLVVAAATGVAMFWRPSGGRLLRRVEHPFLVVARRDWVFLALAAAPLLLSPALALVMGLPEPRIHDEFSYLLQADTFAHGRLTNPSHPLWNHFENFHIIHQPTYASKFPPGQGLFLALGQVLGHPILGVWISTALAGTAILWMLSGLFPRAWALAGVVLAMFNPQVLLWNWSYWGGMVALLGGALALGGFFRNLKAPGSNHSAMMGLGLGILCISRPFEGFALTLLLSAAGLFVFWRKEWGWKALRQLIIVPVAWVVIPVLLFQAYYNFRVTGNALKMPYAVYETTYSRAPLFLWQSSRPQTPHYSNPMMARLYAEYTDPFFALQRTVKGFCQAFLYDKLRVYTHLAWDRLLLVLVPPVILVSKRSRICRLVLGLLLSAIVVTFVGPVWALPHYSAPFFPLVLALLIFGLRELRAWRWGTLRWGRWAARGMFVSLCLYGCIEFVRLQRVYLTGWPYQRAALQSMLRVDGKKHLVIVKYGPSQDIHEAWVWNAADIDRSPVVWANDMGEQENQKLLDYFKGYQVTVVEPEAGKVTSRRE